MRVRVSVRVRADTPDPTHREELVRFLRGFRDWTQFVIDEVWRECSKDGRLVRVPPLKELHHRFYHVLRGQGFRGRHCSMIINRAREVLKSVKSNRGSKPVLRRLTARDDRYDFRFDADRLVLRLPVLDGGWVELVLMWSRKLERYLRVGTLKATTVSFDGESFWVSLVFEVDVSEVVPRAVMGIDVNFGCVAYAVVSLDGELLRMGTIPFRGLVRVLRRKELMERFQRRHRGWRYVKRFREHIKRLGRRIRNIMEDSTHHISNKVIEIAVEEGAVIAMENLKNIRVRSNGKGRGFKKRITLWAFRKLQEKIQYKATLKGLKTIKVNPRNTSKTSPIGGELKFLNYRHVKLPNGHTLTRDLIAAWNIALKALKTINNGTPSNIRCGGGWQVVPLNAPDQMQTQEGMKGKTRNAKRGI